MRILIAGTGAVGGYFGGRLLEAGRDVTFFVRPQRLASFASHGLHIHSAQGNADIDSPRAVSGETLDGPYDLVLMSCKAQDLTAVMESAAAAVGKQTAVVPLLNGLRHLDLLDQRFGKERILGGQCLISATRDNEGNIIHIGDFHTISFGERDKTRSPRAAEIDQFLSNAGFDCKWSDDILQDMWDKWVFIGTGAGITCLMRASIGDIVAAGASDLTVALIEECAAVAAKEGFATSEAAKNRIRETFTRPGSPLNASMLRDVERHAPVEADHILGDLFARGRHHGLSTPVLRIAYAHLRSYEERRKRELNAAAAGG